jgi:hypothetical protein
MSRLEFCREVLLLLGGKWPYPGALADASGCYTKKTPAECVAWMTIQKAKRDAKNARRA